MGERPEVSGLSPRSGTETGGVKITIRGNNLGTDAYDLMGMFWSPFVKHGIKTSFVS